jgi:hypothetical protein
MKRNHVNLCDKKHLVQHDLTYTCLGNLLLKMNAGVRQQCKFEQRPVQEIVYQLTDTENLVYSPKIQTSTIIYENSNLKPSIQTFHQT